MTTHKDHKEGLRERFNEKCHLVVKYKQGGNEIIDFDYMKDQTEEVLDFIREELSHQITTIQEMIKSEGETCGNPLCEVNQHGHCAISDRNQAIERLLTKLASLGDKE